jgi:translation elongation factor EF-Tu-like GTPase
LLDDIPHIKLMGGVIIVKKDSTKKLIDFLRGYEAEFYVRDVILLHEDEIALSKSHPIK